MGLIGWLRPRWRRNGSSAAAWEAAFILSRDISNGSTKASAGIRTNVASGVWLGRIPAQQMGRRNPLRLSTGRPLS